MELNNSLARDQIRCVKELSYFKHGLYQNISESLPLHSQILVTEAIPAHILAGATITKVYPGLLSQVVTTILFAYARLPNSLKNRTLFFLELKEAIDSFGSPNTNFC